MAVRAEESRWAACGALVLSLCVIACGGDDASGGDGDAGGSTSSGGSTSVGGTSTGGLPSGGTSSNGGSSSGGTSTGGSGAGGSGDCTGAFGMPRVVLEMPDTSFSGLTVSPDELELIYSAGLLGSGSAQGFFHARRASKADVFSTPVALPELDAACAMPSMTRSGDLTFDGLGFYFTCYDSELPAGSSQLLYARRPSLDAPFVVVSIDYLDVDRGPSVSRDELELFAALGTAGPTKRYTRSDTTQGFSSGEIVAGLDSTIIATPEIAPDGRTLYASQSASNTWYALVEATRSAPDAAFGPLTVLLPEIMNETFGSPAISNDCRSLYFVHYVLETGVLTYRVEVMTR
jgi:hypothetical protein